MSTGHDSHARRDRRRDDLPRPADRAASRTVAREARAGLSALATGILIFLLWDVLSGAVEPIEAALDGAALGRVLRAQRARLRRLRARPDGARLLLRVDEAAGDAPARRRSSAPAPPRSTSSSGAAGSRALTAGQRLALLIAVGIGVHNFGEGLAIGQAAATGAASLAVTLIVGFALAQRDRGLRHLRPDERRGDAPDVGLPRGCSG